ncbi:MAG: efflux RND transporter periplasmic adaptor subunit [Polyangiaceae bacterium]|nr:efflux RND transporter periplasmic adaptor subunit [Polyangiaceae bacterium]
MKQSRPYFAACSLGLLLLLVFSACSPKKEVEEEVVIRPVRVARIAQPGSALKQTLAGVARASQEMQLSFRVNGTITKIFVQRGDQVTKGTKIAELDKKDALLEIERARASVARARAEHRSAQADYQRIRLLFAHGSASQAELDAARALEESKRAMYAAEKKSLELSRSKLQDHQLSAPLDGDIADVPVEVNENVQAGTQNH